VSEIAKKSIETFVTRLGMQAFSVLAAIVIARTLGASGKGLYTYAVSVLAMILTLNSGQSSAISFQYARRHCAPAVLVQNLFRTLITMSVPLVAGLVLIGIFVPGQRSLLAVAAAAPFALYTQSATGLFLSDSNIRTVWVQQAIIIVLAGLVYVPLLIFAHASVWVLFAVWIGGYIASGFYTTWALRSYMHRHEGGQPNLREQFGYGAQITLNAVVAFLNFRIDVFIIMYMLGQTQLGIYSIGIGLGELLWQLSRPIATASFGHIARGSEKEAALMTATCMRHSFALVIFGSVVIFFLAPPLIPIVYGKSFAAAGTVSRFLIPGIIAYSVMPVLARFYNQSLGQPRVPLIFSTLSMVLCAVMTILLIPHIGIIGGAIATSVSYMTAFTASAIYFVRRTGIAPHKLFAFTRGDLVPYRSVVLRAFSLVGR
jgi:O-antigen/teichoic acid export membrane protein